VSGGGSPRTSSGPAAHACLLCCRYRTGKLLFTLAQRLSKHTRRLGAFEAWNKCLSHILGLARAHVESVMFERFLDGAAACPDADCRKSLKVCARCHALLPSSGIFGPAATAS
jgi:acyl-CoA oxidase